MKNNEQETYKLIYLKKSFLTYIVLIFSLNLLNSSSFFTFKIFMKKENDRKII